MKVEYSRRSLADLRKISSDCRTRFGPRVAAALETRIRSAVKHLSLAPASTPVVEHRPGVHVLPLVRYPYRIFYRVAGDTLRILHIRHTSRRPLPTIRL